MRAAQFAQFGSPDVLSVVELPKPELQPGEVLIRIAAVALQPFDSKARAGRIPLPPGTALPLVTGNEFAGTIVTAPEGVGFSIGSAVVGRHTFGCAAEYLAVPAADIAPKPDSLSFAESATFGGTAQTADAALEILPLGSGATLLVQGAAGGVGGFAVQLARLAGATVIGVAGPAHADYLRELGALPLGYGPGLADRIRAVAPQGITAVLDGVGGEALDLSLGLGVDRSNIVSIGDPRWRELGVRWPQGARNGIRLAKLLALAADGRLRPLIRRTFPLADIVAAHRDLETGHGRGKLVVLVE